MEGPLKPVVHDHLSGNKTYITEIVNPAWLKKLLSNELPIPPERRARLLFAMLSVEVWKQSLRLW
jgi:hypothetical protein